MQTTRVGGWRAPFTRGYVRGYVGSFSLHEDDKILTLTAVDLQTDDMISGQEDLLIDVRGSPADRERCCVVHMLVRDPDV